MSLGLGVCVSLRLWKVSNHYSKPPPLRIWTAFDEVGGWAPHNRPHSRPWTLHIDRSGLAARPSLIAIVMASTQPCPRIFVSVCLYSSLIIVANVISFLLLRETAALHQPSLFFPLVDLLTDPSTFPKPLSTLPPEAIHQAATDVAQSSGLFREPDSLPAFQLALALHSASPKLEAFHQYYKDRNLGNIPLPGGTLAEECGSWVDWYGTRICTRQELAAVARREALDSIADNSKRVLFISFRVSSR